MVWSVKFLLAVGGLVPCPYNAFSTPLSCVTLTHEVRVIHCLPLYYVWPKRISNNVCTPGDKMLSETLVSCISWFISAIQLDIGICDHRKSGLLKQQTLFTSTTWNNHFLTLERSEQVEPFSLIPYGAINRSLSGLGKGKGKSRLQVIETACACKVL